MPRSSTLLWLFFGLALLGFIDASYLALKHFIGGPITCGFFASSFLNGCEAVTTSKFSVILGIPISLMGALYYLAILIGSFVFIESKNEKIIRYTLLLTWTGFLFSLYLLFLQVFVLQALCIYCIVSAISSISLWVVARVIEKQNKNNHVAQN